jgi:hypothetical protein
MTNRVMAAIQPEENYTSPVTWTPSTASFVGVAAFAAVVLTVLNPQSGARAWFTTGFLGRDKAKPAVTKPVQPPFPSNTDPFQPPVSPQLKGLLSGQSSPMPTQVDRPSIMRITSPSDPNGADAASGGTEAVTAATHNVAAPQTGDGGFVEQSPTERASRISVPPVTMLKPMPQSATTGSETSPPANAPSADANSSLLPVNSEARSVVMDKTPSSQPPSPPGILASQPNLLQSDLPVTPDGPVSKRSLLQTLTTDSKHATGRKDN